jgi:hypothetical protein
LLFSHDLTGGPHPLVQRVFLPREIVREAESARDDPNGDDPAVGGDGFPRNLPRDGPTKHARLALPFEPVDLASRLIETALAGELVRDVTPRFSENIG